MLQIKSSRLIRSNTNPENEIFHKNYMAVEYLVKQGDCFSIIAKKHGFLLKTLWEYPPNATLKQKRKSPNVLFPGDVIFIPDNTLKEESGATEQRHRFRLETDKTVLQLRLLREDEPRSRVKFSLKIAEKTIESETDSDGWIKETIPAAAKTAKLLLLPGTEDEEEYELLIGHLDPPEKKPGVTDRLQNLGFFFDFEDEDDEAIKYALAGFQGKYELAETGEADAATVNKLKELHGS